MKFFRQLQLLCWKNLKTRFRKKIRLTVELVWPLLLATMICLWRSSDLPETKHECHFASNALPSAGLLPFFQSILCNIQNHCYETSMISEMSGKVSDFEDAGITKFVKDLEDLLKNETLTDSLQKIIKDVGNLQNQISILQQAKDVKGVAAPLSTFIKDPEGFQQYLTDSVGLSPDVAKALINSKGGTALAQSIIRGDFFNPSCYENVAEALKTANRTTVKKAQIELCDDLSPQDAALLSTQLLSQLDSQKFLAALSGASGGTNLPKIGLMDLIQNTTAMNDYLSNELQLPPDVINLLLNDDLTPQELQLLLEGHEMRPVVCNETALQTYIPTASEADVRSVSQTLCDLTDAQLDEFSEKLKTSLNKSAVVDYLSSTMDLDELQANVTQELLDFMQEVQQLESFNRMVTELTASDDPNDIVCGSLTGSVFDFIKGNASDFLPGGGGSIATGGAKEFSTKDDDEPDEAKRGFRGRKERDLPKEYAKCQWVSNLTSTTQGVLIWKQIKPLVQGYILYTPDTKATRRIIQRAREPLDTLDSLTNIAEQWLAFSPSLKEALNKTTNQDCINNNFKLDPGQFKGFLKPAQVEQINDQIGFGLDQMNISSLDVDTVLVYIDQMDQLAATILTIMECVVLDKFVPVASKMELEDIAKLMLENNTLWAAVIFENFKANEENDVIPTYVNYTIRMDSDKVELTHKLTDRFWVPKPREKAPYVHSGFVYVQDLIESAVVKELSEVNSSSPGVWFQQFPYPCYVDDEFLLLLSGLLPLLMILAWVFTVAMIIKSIVFEKERRLKEVMKVMGLGNGVHWLAWFIDSFIMMFISSFLLIVIMKYGKLIFHSDISVLMLFMVSFSVSTIMLCFLISVFFSKANLAAACGAVLYFLTYIPYVMVYVWDARIAVGYKYGVSFMNTIAFGYGCMFLTVFEIQGKGVQWDNINTSPLTGDKNMTFLQVIGMMWLDAFIYGLLTWYIEAVHPGHYGIPKPWYFPFTRSYWCEYRPPKDQGPLELDQQNLSDDFEAEPSRLQLGVSIQNMVKVYKAGRKVAVDKLSLNFYEDQITSFLGHNGAGKTTTISILTGLFPPTAGTAYIYGKNILTDMDEIRKSLGMCPQHNVLFENLTVGEHLWFFARLKGMPEERVLLEMDQILEDLVLPHKKDEMPGSLSGGMKRKLSIAIAFLGGAKCVILDEPTAGVDPYSRREIWDLLNKYRKGRTIIMSTHHMDEADILGDRIAIIANGKVQCCGSSLFLKGRYGHGYYLVLTKATTSMELRRNIADAVGATPYSNIEYGIQEMGYCSEPIVTDFIQRFIPGASLCENLGQELSYLLPFGAIKGFETLFKELEDSASKLHIANFGISDTSLEEVFLTVAEDCAEFKTGEINKSTDDGRLPRPFMGRGSLRRRDYQLAASLGRIDDQALLLDHDVSDNVHHHQESQPPPVRDDDHDSALGEETQEDESQSKEKPEAGAETGENLTEGAADDALQFKQHFGHRRNVSFGSRPEHTPVVSDMPEELLELQHMKVTGGMLILWQFAALIIKRFHHARRSFKGFLAQVILPAVFILFAMLFATLRLPVEQPKSLPLVPWIYDTSKYVFYGKDSTNDTFASRIEESIISEVGIGARCLEEDYLRWDGFFCQQDKATDFRKYNLSEELYRKYVDGSLTCSCTSGFEICDEGAEGPQPPDMISATTDIVQNMTSRNISDYIIKTTSDMILQRFGGFNFLIENDLASLEGENISALVDMWKDLNDTLADLKWCGDEDTDIYLPSEEFFEEIFEVLVSLARLDNVKVWFNNNGYHALPTYINMMNNQLLRASVPPHMANKYGITARNHPLNFTKSQLLDEIEKTTVVDQFIAQFVMFGFAFIPAGFVIYVITERVSSGKHLQFVSGVNPSIYWLSTFAWDMVNYLVPCILTLLIFFAFQMEAFISPDVLPALIVLMLLYGWASAPMTYPISNLFHVPSTAYLSVGCLNILIGMFTVMSSFIIDYIAITDPSFVSTSLMLKKLFLLFPPYCLGRGLVDLASNHLLKSLYRQYEVNYEAPLPFAWDQLGRNMFALSMEGIFFMILTLLIEYRFFIKPRTVAPSSNSYEEEDDDVRRERDRVTNGGAERDIIKIENLTKVYNTSRGLMKAVNKLCVGVPRGECFGLLGVNGAGKTTTFKMLTGDTHVSSGSAKINSYSILTQMRKVNQSIGYCPQFDALDDLLTGMEHLQFYARLRGVPEEYVTKVAEWGIQKLGLTNYAFKPAGTYSGGNKRKLSTAIALVGNPPVIFLDEPTTGMDPKSRRFLWNCITKIVKEGRSVVLTTHSMEECEALCTRLAIMVNGTFKCLGSTQHLKTKFGDGYVLTLRASSSLYSLDLIFDFIATNFEGSSLREQHLNMLEFQLPSTGTALSRLFGIMEAHRHELSIEDYSICQTTLDQVFINFAKKQRTGDEDESDSGSVLEPNVHFSSSLSGDPGNNPAIVHIPNFGTVHSLPNYAFPSSSPEDHLYPGQRNPMYNAPGGGSLHLQDDQKSVQSDLEMLQTFGDFSEA